jgi:signal-transduction protein with cAMP-binding, CBS, and nucleotidyltransferase domain
MEEVSYYLVDEQVRCNVLFHDLPNKAVAYLVPILGHRECEPADRIVTTGDPGTHMFIILDGKAYFESGHQWSVQGKDESDDEVTAADMECKQTLQRGDSFGEEIILGLEEEYAYTINAFTIVRMYCLAEDVFVDAFRHMPEIVHRMHDNFVAQQNAPPKPSPKPAPGPADVVPATEPEKEEPAKTNGPPKLIRKPSEIPDDCRKGTSNSKTAW